MQVPSLYFMQSCFTYGVGDVYSNYIMVSKQSKGVFDNMLEELDNSIFHTIYTAQSITCQRTAQDTGHEN